MVQYKGSTKNMTILFRRMTGLKHYGTLFPLHLATSWPGA